MKNPDIDTVGTNRWYNEAGELHREENDLPAIEYADVTKAWWINGKPHRENGLPALEYANGTKVWYNKSGVRYRYDEWIRFSWQLVPF